MKTMYWSRRPGNFVNKNTGKTVFVEGQGPKFTGSVREWYETLIETMIDVSAGMRNAKIYVNRDVGVIFECSVMYRMNLDKALPFSGKVHGFEVHIDDRMPRGEVKIVEGTDIRKVVVLDMNIV
jgi:hypothetical protein